MLSTKNIFLKDIIVWLLFPLVIGLITLSFIPGWSRFMIAWGVIYVVIYFFYSLFMEYKIQPEVIIYFVWVIWSLSGLFFILDMDIYIEMLIRVVQMGSLIFVVAGIVSLRKDPSLILAAFAIGGIILGLISFITGEFQTASNVESELQANSIAENANVFAYHLLFVIISLFYFWERLSGKFWRTLFIMIVVFTFWAIVLSGSRQGFVAVILFILLWFFNCKGKLVLQNPKTAVALILFITLFIFVMVQYILPETLLGERFIDQTKQSDSKRVKDYLDGLEMLKDYPIFGVGLDHFRVHSYTNTYSHSYYMEILVSTGIIGFILYFSIYVLLWQRLVRMKKASINKMEVYNISFIQTVLITILLIGLTRPLIVSKITTIFLGCAIGYSWALERSLRSEKV